MKRTTHQFAFRTLLALLALLSLPRTMLTAFAQTNNEPDLLGSQPFYERTQGFTANQLSLDAAIVKNSHAFDASLSKNNQYYSFNQGGAPIFIQNKTIVVPIVASVSKNAVVKTIATQDLIFFALNFTNPHQWRPIFGGSTGCKILVCIK